MPGAEHFRAWSPADVLLDDQIARVEVALRPNPRVVADQTSTVEAALELCSRFFPDEEIPARSKAMLEDLFAS